MNGNNLEVILDRSLASHSSQNESKINTKTIQKQLLEMGYSIDMINQVIRYFEVTTIEAAIDYLSFTNGKWNHPFVMIDSLGNNEVESNNLCLICKGKEEIHINFNRIPVIRDNPLNPNNNSLSFRKSPSENSIQFRKEPIQIKNEKVCDICLSPMTVTFKLECKHFFCNECVLDYLTNKITNAEVVNIKCPSPDCVVFIKEEIIKTVVPDEMFVKYQRFLKRADFLKIPDSSICPFPDCDSYGIKTTALNNPKEEKFFIVCQNGHHFCYNCNQPSHKGFDCDAKLEKEFFKWKESKTVKKCPRCAFYIEKNFGCNHMTCANKICNYEFCWICMNEFQNNHYSIPGTPCFGLQYTNERSWLVRFPILRYLRILFVLVGILLSFILGYVFLSLIFSLGIYVSFVVPGIQRELFRRNSYVYSFIWTAAAASHFFFIGMIYIPLGWILAVVALLFSPVFFIIWFLAKNLFRVRMHHVRFEDDIEMQQGPVIQEPVMERVEEEPHEPNNL